MAAGLAEPTMDMTASNTISTTTEQQYSVVAVDPNVAIPNSTIVTGTRTVQDTSEQTITMNGTHRPPMSPIERYENMIDDLPSLSSDSSPPTPATPPPTVSSGSSSETNTVQHIMNHMEFPPGGPTDNANQVAGGLVKKEQFKVMIVLISNSSDIDDMLPCYTFQTPTLLKGKQQEKTKKAKGNRNQPKKK